MEILKKIWYWLKSYWALPVVIILIILSAIVLQKSKIASQLLQSMAENYQRQIDVLNKLNEEEKRKREELKKQYETALEALQAKYDSESKELTNAEKEKVKQLVEQYKNDSRGLNDKLAETFGLSIGG